MAQEPLDYQSIFRQLPLGVVVLDIDKPHFTILECSAALAAAVGKKRDALVGKPVLQACLPDADDSEANGSKKLVSSLLRCLEEKQPIQLPLQRYDMEIVGPNGDLSFEERYWAVDNHPIYSETDPTKVICILHRTRDVTDFVKGKAAMERSTQLESESQSMKVQIMERAAELDRTNECLRDINERLNSALATKSDFIANVSHELRTPLNAIIGFAQALKDSPGMTETQRPQIHLIYKSGKHLLSLVNDLLDMARIDSGKLELTKESLSPAHIASEVAEMLLVNAQQKGLKLTVSCDPSLPAAVLGDPVRLRQMLLNLVGNAVKFTSHGEVSIFASARPCDSDIAACELSYFVQDTGPGIPDDALKKMFTRFNQAGNRVAIGSTGLGLAITRELARLMSGDVFVSSQVGVGSKFELKVMLPLSTLPNLTDILAAESFTLVRPAQRGLPVLVVDDVETNRQVACYLLEQLGFNRIIASSNGIECLEILRTLETLPCCILMDLFMPEMDGFEAVRIIRQSDLYKDIPVIAVSASVVDFEGKRADLKSFTAVLPKPYDIQQLKYCLTKFSGIEFVQSMGGESLETPHTLLELEPVPSSTSSQRRILVVDDDATNRCVLASLLTKLGHSYQLCQSGSEAIDAVINSESALFDVILTDKYMPGMSGLETTKAIRSLNLGPLPRIVLITAADLSENEKVELRDAGISMFLPKPFKIAELVHSVAGESCCQRPGKR